MGYFEGHFHHNKSHKNDGQLCCKTKQRMNPKKFLFEIWRKSQIFTFN
jgi:hypothetical protein